MTADKIIYGNIYTVDREQPRAAAAAIAGETRWVRPPFPIRPSKFRLLVPAQR